MPHTLPSDLPQPDPPTILESTLPDSSSSLSTSSAPYAPFLSHAPPPPECRLEITTSESYYRLDVRLPGFTREGITLATKRRRILHVTADMWDDDHHNNGRSGTGGGHFERRVAFGYDADLGHVRAEFDGCVLRIVIPRRTPGVFLGR
ncbi:hypothetical protein CPB83DRAFT_765188 [Crepidotus variabilis]|uniref:SHSP domain-containing protein n=1 Tax=Crepidotus variabilis TaxID=179855 RepID=A0A9P6JQZ7_9AGAR|nr:hypothetical protein CPB83DRAFT_765188 [Crepidotus variabilis]